MEVLKDPKVLISVISSITAIIAALVAIINTRLSLKQTGRNNENLELLKYEIEKKKTFSKLSEAHILQRLNAMDNHIKRLQEFKDNLIIIIESIDDSLSVKSADIMIKNARENFFKEYQSSSMHLEEHELKASHDAKNAILKIDFFLDKTNLNKKIVKNSAAEINTLSEFKNQLTDYQNILRDSKSKILHQY